MHYSNTIALHKKLTWCETVVEKRSHKNKEIIIRIFPEISRNFLSKTE